MNPWRFDYRKLKLGEFLEIRQLAAEVVPGRLLLRS